MKLNKLNAPGDRRQLVCRKTLLSREACKQTPCCYFGERFSGRRRDGSRNLLKDKTRGLRLTPQNRTISSGKQVK